MEVKLQLQYVDVNVLVLCLVVKEELSFRSGRGVCDVMEDETETLCKGGEGKKFLKSAPIWSSTLNEPVLFHMKFCKLLSVF